MTIHVANGSAPAAVAAAPPVLPTPIVVNGNSIPAGTWLTTPTTDRIGAKLAKAFGTTEANSAVSGSGFLTDNGAAYGKLAQGGNWVTLGTAIAPAKRTRAPYLASVHAVDLITGINDIAQFGPVNSGFLAAWQAATFAAACHARLGHFIPAGDAALTPSGSWALNAAASTFSYGGKSWGTAVNGQTVSHVVAADYDGQAITFFTLFVFGNATQYATYTITGPGGTLASGSSQAAAVGLPLSGTHAVLPMALRVPTPTPATFQGQTLTLTTSAIGGSSPSAFCSGVGYESNPAPIVILSDTLRSSLGYSGYATFSWPYTPTDSDITAVNVANQQTAALFSDGHVISDGADALLNKSGTWLPASGNVSVHPDERNTGVVAGRQQSLLVGLLTPTILGQLGL